MQQLYSKLVPALFDYKVDPKEGKQLTSESYWHIITMLMEHTVKVYQQRSKELSDARIYFMKNNKDKLYEEVYDKFMTEFRILFEEELVKVMENSAGHEDAIIEANNREKENVHYWLRFDDLMYEQRGRVTDKLLTQEKTKYIFAEALMKELCIQYAFMDSD
jgi:hypothetical protein